MALRITTLTENTAGGIDIIAEWGLSFLVESDGAKVLFDTGRSISAPHNADSLGINLGEINKIALSHGHVDHTGGLREVLQRMKKEIEITAHPDVWAAKHRHWTDNSRPDRFNGIPFQRRELESLGAIFNLTREPVRMTDTIMTTGEIPMTNDFEDIPSSMVVEDGGRIQPDKLMDDLALVISTASGLVILLGCAHHGIVNTLYHAQQLTGEKKIRAVIGGGHLIDTSDERIWRTVSALKDLEVERIALCHCTGLRAIGILSTEFGDRFTFNTAGSTIEFP
ncbi:MBL fold metallo-hydrolase [Chloroflexota bacterium]